MRGIHDLSSGRPREKAVDGPDRPGHDNLHNLLMRAFSNRTPRTAAAFVDKVDAGGLERPCDEVGGRIPHLVV